MTPDDNTEDVLSHFSRREEDKCGHVHVIYFYSFPCFPNFICDAVARDIVLAYQNNDGLLEQ